MKRLLLILVTLLLLSIRACDVQAQVVSGAPQQVAIVCAYNTSIPPPVNTSFFLVQCNSSGQLITSAGGAAGGTSSTFGAAFPATGTAAGAEYLSVAPTLTSGQMNPFILDVNGNLLINSPSILTAIQAPITPCVTSACATANPIGNVLSNTAGAVVTVPVATPGIVTWTNHGLTAGQPVVFATTGNLPGNLVPGVPYYVVPTITANTFEVAATVGGAAIAFVAPAPAGVQTAMAYQVGPLTQALATNAASSPITTNIGAPNPLMADQAGQLRVAPGSWASLPNGGINLTNVSHSSGSIVGTRGSPNQTQPLQFLRTGDGGELDLFLMAATQVWAIGLKCYVFNAFPGGTTFTEASAPAIAAADVPKLIAWFNMSPPDSSLGTMTVWTAGGPPGSEKALKIPLYNLTAFYTICIMASGAPFTPTANTFTAIASGLY